MWLWSLCPLDDPDVPYYGTTIDSFISEICRQESTIYFHNLKFDGAFILDRIMKTGYTHTHNKPKLGEFTALISGMGQFYTIKVRWREGGTTEFRDSLKKLPMSADAIAKAFNLDESKGIIDYDARRPAGYVPTSEEIDYVTNDVTIIAKALRQQINAGMTKLTVGSDSLAEFKRMTDKSVFKRVFPILPVYVDSDIRRAYRGGFTYAAKKYRGKITGPGRVYDVNSLYPAVMYYDPMPYGEPIFRPGGPQEVEGYPLFVISITFTAKLKPDHVPCIQVKGSHFIATEYLESIDEPTTISCTSVDLDLWNEHYDMNILAWHGAWYFRSAIGLFKDYIDKWTAVKVNSHGGMRVIAKLHLNSLYGKFATNPDITGKEPYLDGDVVKLRQGPQETRDPVYTPVGVFVTAHARARTVRAAQAHFSAFAYADTDSLHLIVDDDPPTLDIDDSRMGAWKRELEFTAGLYVRSKCYTEQDAEGRFHTHIAGMPVKIAETLTFDDFVDGRVFPGKLTPKRVSGGVVLSDVGFTLNT